MKKIINFILVAIAIFMFGYYLGSLKSFSTKSNYYPVIKKNKEKKNTKKASHEVAIDSIKKIVSFDIKVIAASMNNSFVDKELENIKTMFDSVTNFSEFKLIKNENFDVALGHKHKVLLPDNNVLYIVPKSIEGESLKLAIRIPWILNANLSVRNEEGFFQGGLRHGDQFIILYIKPIFE